ncbi:hypothetical protein GP486_002482 [Trichoglossum hirsutum]|uniref:PAZ domain-containing protein n=1 Tax=Trichoglossum hirsutum TaxID=265104 RepID=A0A9P8LF02_9PEZI|nr:hypothetical protein GP486_002482 [Trichoglossum hirsutum]
MSATVLTHLPLLSNLQELSALRTALGRPRDEPLAPNPSREVEKAEDAIAKNKDSSLKSLSLAGKDGKPPFPNRPGYGTLGQPIVLRTNYFHVVPKELLVLHRYIVQFSPEVLSPRKKRRLFALLFECPVFAEVRNSVATDYRSIVITPKELPLDGDSEDFIVTYHGVDEAVPRADAAEHTVTLSGNATLDVGDLVRYLTSTERDASYDKLEEMTQALNIIMARSANTAAGIVPLTGNKFFPMSGASTKISGGLVSIRGYYTSVRRATLRVLLNLNVCNAAFYEPSKLSNLIARHINELQFDDDVSTWRKVEKFIDKLRVETSYLKNKSGESVRRFRTVCGFVKEPQMRFGNSRQVKFNSEYGTISVEAFFKESKYINIQPACRARSLLGIEHNIDLADPNCPVVNVGTMERPCYLPPELCLVLPGQVINKRLHERQTREMMNSACKPPAKSASHIVEEGLRVVGVVEGHSESLVSLSSVSLVMRDFLILALRLLSA